MFPSAVEYRAPGDIGEALALLREHGDDAKVLAGGMSLVPLLKLRFATPALLVDIGRVDGLSGITRENGSLRIGARTTHADVEAAHLEDTCRILADAAPQISDPLIRNMGTVGGSLCHGDPQGDWATVMLALNAECDIRSASGERTVTVADLLDGPFTTTLEPDEIMTSIRIPLPHGASCGTYLKLERKVGDFATVGVAVQIEFRDDGHVASAGIALTAVGATQIKATTAEAALVGQTPSTALIAEVARLAAEAAEPRGDIRGSVEFKRDIVRVYTQRALRTAIVRALETPA